MKKTIKFIFLFVLFLFPFCEVKAVSSYSVELVNSSSFNKVVGTYNSYNEAVNVMNGLNSSESSVATIYKDGIPVDSKYAIFKFKPSGKGTYSLYRNSNSTSAFTSINSSYGIDAAVLGYSDNGRVKIMISGFTGWTDINNGVVTPISLLGGNMININGSSINLRSDHSTSSSKVASLSGSYNFSYTETYKGSDYTWYKISYEGKECWAAGGYWVTPYNSSLGTYYKNYGLTGNLIHHFTTYGGVDYNDSFTNLGTAPSYMAKDVWYYSFDGNYFYSNLTSMLEDYRTGGYARSINSNNPHYAYYVYLTSRSTTGYTAADFDNVISAKYNAEQSKMYATGAYFKEAEEKYGTNALLAFSAALNESSWGTSSIAMNKNNLFGYGAADSCPYECAYSYSSPRDSILDYASKSSTSYETASGKYYNGSHYGNKSSGKNVYYATDPYWGETMASNAFNRDKSFGGKDFNSNTIGVTKKGVSGVAVYKNPDTSSYLYTLKNSKRSDAVYDFSVNVVDKVTNNGKEFYKVYTDLEAGNVQFGYVLSSNFYVSNTQPVITASDKTIDLGEKFNYLEGVTASDKENGNLTNKIIYEGAVDTNKAGNYKVTYTVADNSNFHVNKEINVKVVGGAAPILEASDKKIIQFEDFDYMKDVKATDNSGDITSNITYEGIVNTNKAGIYNVKYKVSNAFGTTEKTVKVEVILNEKPVIEAADKNIFLNDNFNYLEGVRASDKEDGDLTSKIVIEENNVDTSITGEYRVVYSVKDKHGQATVKTIKVNVSERKIDKGTSEFYFDSLNIIGGKLQIKGYDIIKEINNTLDMQIKYELIFKDTLNGSEYVQELSRITNELSSYVDNGKDYTYSWFIGDIDFSKIPQGDYITYLKASSSDYYVKDVVSNKLLNEQVSNYSKDGKYVTITNDYVNKDAPIVFSVRDSQIGKKETSAFTNQYSFLENISLDDGMLYLKGASYSSGVDLRKGTNLVRNIIFENQNTFKTYSYNLGYLEKGPYIISLYGSDKFGKDKDLAWYENTIDLKDLPKGNYTIYIANKSNISDFGELKDMLMYVDFSKTTDTYNGKEYKLLLNKNARYRVELSVK